MQQYSIIFFIIFLTQLFMKIRQKHQQRKDQIAFIQQKLYQAIQFKRNQLNQELQLIKDKYQCEQYRSCSMKNRNIKETIKHPYNECANTEGRWRQIGYCIDQLDHLNLDDIRQRQYHRLKQQNELRKVKIERQQQALREIKKKKNKQPDFESQKGSGKMKSKQIPWKLMRKLREHDVRENKRRIEQAAQHQKAKINKFHK